MNFTPRPVGIAIAANTVFCLVLAGCGMMSAEDFLDRESTSPSTLNDTGNYNFSCGDRNGSKSKQSPFKQHAGQNSACQASQKLEFPQKKVADYDIDLDCSAGKVVVHHRGADQRQQELPIQSNGNVRGKLQYQQAIQSDGKGNSSCWVKYEVNFDGKAQCGHARQTERLKLDTHVSFKKSDIKELQRSGIAGTQGPGQDQGQNPGQDPDQNPGQNPDQDPDQNPDQNPGPQHPSPRPTPTHPGGQHPHPDPVVTQRPDPGQIPAPIVVCDVEEPCPMVGSTEMSCGD